MLPESLFDWVLTKVSPTTLTDPGHAVGQCPVCEMPNGIHVVCGDSRVGLWCAEDCPLAEICGALGLDSRVDLLPAGERLTPHAALTMLFLCWWSVLSFSELKNPTDADKRQLQLTRTRLQRVALNMDFDAWLGANAPIAVS